MIKRLRALLVLWAFVVAGLPAGQAGDSLLFFHTREAERLRERVRQDDPPIRPLADAIRKQAGAALKAGPWSVTFSRPPGVAISPNDFFSEGPYWWPDPRNPKGPYIRRDGERNPDRFTANDNDLGSMSRAVFALSLSAYLLDDAAAARRAAELLRVWFIVPSTRMNPNLEYGQAIKGVTTGRGIGIIDTVPLIWAAQGLSLLEASGRWPEEDAAAVRAWFREYLNWLTTSQKGTDEKNNGNNHSTWWSAQVAAFSLFVGDAEAYEMTCRLFKEYLVPHQIRPDGSCPLEEQRTRSLGYSAMNLNGFALLCRMAEVRGQDLWRYRASEGAGVLDAVRYLFPFIKDPDKWKKRQITGFDPKSVYFHALAGLATGDREYLDQFMDKGRKADKEMGRQGDKETGRQVGARAEDPPLLVVRLLLAASE